MQPHTPLRKLLAASAVIILALVVTFALLCYLPLYKAARQIGHYSGDGEIHDISFTFLWIPITGYKIEFERIPLDQPFSKKYTLQNLPSIQYDPVIYFRAFRDSGISHKQPFGTISLRVTDSKGGTHINLQDIPAEDFIWTYGGSGPFDLYIPHESGFSPEKGETYSLEVSFTPAKPAIPTENNDTYGIASKALETISSEPVTSAEAALYIRAGGSI